MFKKINLLLILLCSAVTMAQQSTSSPYSFYGIGDIKFKGTAENRLMGSISVFPDSTHVNIQNPAAYPSLNLTTYTVGGSFNSSRLNSFYGNEKAQRTTLDYMAVGIPMKKLGLGFGLIPYSAVGYRIRNTEADGTIHRYNASGGLNKVFVGLGYKVTANFSVGADIQYNFGRIETVGIEKIPDAQLGSQEMNTSDLSGVNFDFSMMYKRKINSKLDGYASLLLSPQGNLTSKNTRVISTVLYSDIFDPQNYDVMDPIYSKNAIKLPAKATLGFGAGRSKKWMLGTEFTFQQTSKFGNRYNDIQNVTYKNAFRYSLGGYYIPNYASFSNYLKKITYRGGFRYEDTGMKINNETIRDYAFSAGMGLPLGGAFSNLNLGVEYGRRGTAKALLIEENYTNVILSVSLNDRWFIKRKYD